MSKHKTDRSERYVKEIDELNEQLKTEQVKRDETKQALAQYQREFHDGERKRTALSRLARRLLRFFRSIAAYLLGRRNIKHLYSRTFKTKNALNQLKTNKYFLYNLGFVERSLQDLKQKLHDTNDSYLQRAINWELGLWYANLMTADGAKRALPYFREAMNGEKNQEQLRKGTILQAECYERLAAYEQGRYLVQARLQVEQHPDLYLAMANLEETIEARMHWINHAMNYYNLQEITFRNLDTYPTYEDLQTMPIKSKVSSGPKVSVLLPAYNAENGIDIAIESILNQTWTNLELIVVDDCSTDQTVSIIKQYEEKDERIKLLSTPENSGPYIARNIGLQHATGKFVTVNDADDWSHAEKIAIQANHLMQNSHLIANTSEHARLTEKLTLHRRGTPGLYIFSNMSSLMFVREPVIKKIGYWDSVRFAADGEFKRRLINVFGSEAIVDLQTGPLSLPRQSSSSLTGSSAFGYRGYFMGVRKEYVESFTHYHQKATTLYYPYPMKQRPFPVPEPMWPKREAKQSGSRHFDVVIAADFHKEKDIQLSTIKEINVHKKLEINTGIIHMSCYNMNRPKELSHPIRELINGQEVQVLVYGEEISCEVLIIRGHSILTEEQLYIPNLKPKMVVVIVDDEHDHFRQSGRRIVQYFNKRGVWYAYNERLYNEIQTHAKRELSYIHLANEPWLQDDQTYESRLEDWLTDQNPYIKK